MLTFWQNKRKAERGKYRPADGRLNKSMTDLWTDGLKVANLEAECKKKNKFVSIYPVAVWIIKGRS